MRFNTKITRDLGNGIPDANHFKTPEQPQILAINRDRLILREYVPWKEHLDLRPDGVGINFYNLLTLFRCQLCPKNLYKQQQKLFQQQRIVQSQRLKRVRQLLEDHTKNLQDLQRSHEAQQVTVQEQLRKEINMLQKKILTDTVRRLSGDVMVTSRFLEQN